MIISAREANQQFSRLLETAANGETVTITRRGVPVAKLVPVVERPQETEAEQRRRARKQEILALFDKGFKGRAFADWTREELYDREADRRETPECG